MMSTCWHVLILQPVIKRHYLSWTSYAHAQFSRCVRCVRCVRLWRLQVAGKFFFICILFGERRQFFFSPSFIDTLCAYEERVNGISECVFSSSGQVKGRRSCVAAGCGTWSATWWETETTFLCACLFGAPECCFLLLLRLPSSSHTCTHTRVYRCVCRVDNQEERKEGRRSCNWWHRSHAIGLLLWMNWFVGYDF